MSNINQEYEKAKQATQQATSFTGYAKSLLVALKDFAIQQRKELGDEDSNCVENNEGDTHKHNH